jgi:23S rRNA (uridine2552-2'-O)-methyltransferase
VLDIGAAPGSWTMYCAAKTGPSGYVCAVDLTEITVPERRNTAPVHVLQGDAFDDETVSAITACGPFNVVLSDAAPSTTGNRIVDTGRSEALVESILDRLDIWLVENGTLVVKLFQGGGEQRIVGDMRERFRTAYTYRPDAVRRESFETYLIGIGYKKEAISQ